MLPLQHIRLDYRAILSLGGADVREFLQGLITCDIDRLGADNAVYGALLTPQGKFQHDFLIFESGGAIHLDCEAAGRDDLARRLAMYRLRADVTIGPAAGAVHALIGDGACAALGLETPGAVKALKGGSVYADPRSAGLGARAWLAGGDVAEIEQAGFAAAPLDAYDGLRISLGVPDGSRDWLAGVSFALEAGLEALHGVDFDKGCYVGQEVTARMKHRDLVRKRILPVRLAGAAPGAGTPILNGEVAVGEIRSSAGDGALALLRLDQLDAGNTLTADDIAVTPINSPR